MEGVYLPCSGGFLFLLFLHLSSDNDVGSTLYRWTFGSTLFNSVWFGFFYRAYIVYQNLSASYGNSPCIAMT